MQTHKTELGMFVQDESGMWHYRYEGPGRISVATEDAIKNNPGVAWFWFNGTPAPILKNDTPDSLYNRWVEWRNAFQKSPAILTEIRHLMKSEQPTR